MDREPTLFESGHRDNTRQWFVYVLRDPRECCHVRYVGWTFNVKRRAQDHWTGADKPHTHKARWVKKLRSENVRPMVDVVESGRSCGWAEAERRWIRIFVGEGCQLTNATSGGDGVPGLKMSVAARAKMSAKKKGRRLTPEHCRRISAANMGKRVLTAEQKAKMQAGRARTPLTAEHRAKLVKYAKARFHTPEAIRKSAATRVGRKLSDETKAKIGRANSRPMSMEQREKLSLIKLGLIPSAAKMRAQQHAT